MPPILPLDIVYADDVISFQDEVYHFDVVMLLLYI